jgi:hypothetical protein
MRGGVGVKNSIAQKMPEIMSTQAFHAVHGVHPSAHLAQQEFQLFYSLTLFLKWIIIRTSAQLNLENYIYIGFQHPAIAISLTPY